MLTSLQSVKFVLRTLAGIGGRRCFLPSSFNMTNPPTLNFTKPYSDFKKTPSSSCSNTRKMSKDIAKLYYTDMVPWNDAGSKETREFLNRLTAMLLKYIEATNDRKEKVLNFKYPEDLLKSVDLSLPDNPRNLEELLKDCEQTLEHQVKSGHPYFFNQLSQGLDTISMAGEWLASTTNTNMFTYEIAPVYILMESVVLKRMREVIGFKGGDSVFAPGGTIANLYAIICARHRKFPQYKEEGFSSIPGNLVVFTSEFAHYSIKSGCMVAGLGTDNCHFVPGDNRGKIIPSELERMVKEAKARGKIPLMVSCSAGSTVFGAYDPIEAIADICQKYDMWLHIDGAHGGSLIMSNKYKPIRFKGAERCDSFTWNPHKLLTTNLQCSTIHLKDETILTSCNQMCADYLFQPDKHYDVSYDTGDKTIQCGRHNDVFKFWLQWRAKGTNGIEKHVDHLMAMSEYMVAQIKTMPDRFHLIVEDPEFVNVCFWYVPERLRKMPHGPGKIKLLGEVCPKLKRRMMEDGTLMVGYQPQKDLPNFFRNIISNPAVKKDDIDFLLAEMDRLGKDL